LSPVLSYAAPKLTRQSRIGAIRFKLHNTNIRKKVLQCKLFFKFFFALHLHFVKERAAYSISNFGDFKFNTAIYNKDLKYASVFKFFLQLHCACAALCCIVLVLHCAALRCIALRCMCRNYDCIALHCLQHCIAGCNFSSYC